MRLNKITIAFFAYIILMILTLIFTHNPEQAKQYMVNFLVFALVLILIVGLIYGIYSRQRRIQKAEAAIQKAQVADPMWQEEKIINYISEIFTKFHNDWTNFQTEEMKGCLSEKYWQTISLELEVLKNMQRQYKISDVQVESIKFMDAIDDRDNAKDSMTVEIKAHSQNSLIDMEDSNEMFASSGILEYWYMVRNGNTWELDRIKQWDDTDLKEKTIVDFAEKNGFYFEPHFGWIMMPTKGILFQNASFYKTSVRSHVIGKFRDIIVQFFVFFPNYTGVTQTKNGQMNMDWRKQMGGAYGTKKEFIVAQAILPKEYGTISITQKGIMQNLNHLGLNSIETESNEFNNKYSIWASSADQVNSLELLSPNFMEKLNQLNFDLSIGVTGKYIYFYSENKDDVDFGDMLEIITWAFDEMKL